VVGEYKVRCVTYHTLLCLGGCGNATTPPVPVATTTTITHSSAPVGYVAKNQDGNCTYVNW
jgi:hypothetical protein